LDHGKDNCFDIFRLLTAVANNKLKESLSPPWCAGGQLVSVELENIVRAACSPVGYQRNWHWTNFKKSVRREYVDFPSHNANLMRFPLTPEKILSDNKFIAFLTLEGKEHTHRPVSYMEKVFEEKEIGFKSIEPLSWTVLQRHNNADALEALKQFTTKLAQKVRIFYSQYSSLLDAYTIKRKAWRMTVVAQKVISLFYTYVDSLTVVAYDALTTKESYTEILFTLLFLFEREEDGPELSVVLVQKVKVIYTTHKHRRVPIELAELQTAMKTSLNEWYKIITEKSIEKGGYVYAVSEAKVRDFFFKN
jgi:hypothetical protein